MRAGRPAVFLAALSLCLCSRPPAVQWTRSFAQSFGTQAFYVQQTKDMGFMAEGGMTSLRVSDSSVDIRMFILKIDSMGNTEWQRCDEIGDSGGIPEAVQQTMDGGFAMAGATYNLKVFVRKTDSLWTRQWETRDSEDDDVSDIRQTRDGGFITGGGRRALYLMKLDSLGRVQWRRTYKPGIEHVKQDFFTKCTYHLLRLDQNLYDHPTWRALLPIRQTRDGGFVFAGFVLQKTDAAGNPQWARDYDGALYVMESVEQTNDGGYIATGVGPLGGVFGNFTRPQAWVRYNVPKVGRILLQNCVVLKTDSLGTLEWKKAFIPPLALFRLSMLDVGVQSHGTCIIQTRDGGYAVGGSVDDGRRDTGWLIKMDRRGNPIWTLTLPDWEDVQYCLQTADGGYVIGDGYKHIMKIAPERTR